jgi:ankyrin repeat protein
MIVETLCEAIKKRNTNQKRVITSLIEAGHDVNAFDKHGDCPLSLACKNGYGDIVKYLVSEKGACVNVANNEGDTPLGLAAEHLNLEIVMFLLQQGAYIDILNSNHQTPLIIV